MRNYHLELSYFEKTHLEAMLSIFLTSKDPETIKAFEGIPKEHLFKLWDKIKQMQ